MTIYDDVTTKIKGLVLFDEDEDDLSSLSMVSMVSNLERIESIIISSRYLFEDTRAHIT